jgi:hypothetical protein
MLRQFDRASAIRRCMMRLCCTHQEQYAVTKNSILRMRFLSGLNGQPPAFATGEMEESL